jgi:hypothetical protein
MLSRTNAVLLATLASACACSQDAWGQDINVYGTTLLQNMEQDLPGFGTTTYRPAIQFLGVDADRLGTEGLSLHLYGWGRRDLADQSRLEGKSMGELTYGYLQYRASVANALTQLGRITVHQGTGTERLDGGSARVDLVGGFTLSAFGGRPVDYRTLDSVTQKEYEYQRDAIFGGRLGKRFASRGEVGLSYLQDGSLPAKELKHDNQFDYTRRQVASDLRFTFAKAVDLSGRTVVDIASHQDLPVGSRANTSRIAEHDYTVGWKLAKAVRLDASYTQRNYRAFYSGTNLPSLFNPFEPGDFRSHGLAATFGSATAWEAVVDGKVTHRDSYGKATRIGGELRRHTTESGFQYGVGFHLVNADDVPLTGVLITSYGLSYRELRAWVMYEKGRFTASLDGIHHAFEDGQNPNLYGRSSVYEAISSVGFQATPNFRISGDFLYGITPLLKEESMALLRADYRFGTAGGKK